MHRSSTPGTLGSSAMRPDWVAAFELLLCAQPERERREPGGDAADRQAVSAVSVLRIATDDVDAAKSAGSAGQREAGGAVDASDGTAGDRARTPYQPASSCASGVSVLAARVAGHALQHGLVYRHHLCADGEGLHVSGGHYGLVQPVCPGVGVVEYTGDELLCADPATGPGPAWRAGHLQQRPGSQFTCEEFLGCLEAAAVRISMDGRGRALDNVFIERLWRSLKYENIYPADYRDGHALYGGLQRYFRFYNTQRPHQALDCQTPSHVYRASLQHANSNTHVSLLGEG